MSVLYTTVTLLTLVVCLIYYLSTKKFNYWIKRNVPHLKPVPIFGNYAEFILLKKWSGKVAQNICQQFPGAPYIGTFYGTEPALLLQDPDMIKQVMTKDFYFFNSREIGNYAHKEMLTKNIFFSGGDDWRIARQNLTPLFSSAKLKNMFHLIKTCTVGFESMLDDETSVSDVLETRSLMARYTMDCIVSCCFGIEANTMGKGEVNNPFKSIASLIFDNSKYRGFKVALRAIWPAIFYGIGLQLFPKPIGDFFSQVLKNVFVERKYEPTQRHDFVDLMLNMKKENYITGASMLSMKTGEVETITREVKDELIVTQSVLFFGAGFETSAGTLSFTLFELAKNQEAQNRAIEEVDSYLLKNDNKLDYECITDLPYLLACTYEAVRLYPIFGILTRELVEDYTFANGLQLDKGTRIHLPLYHLHRNPEVFPEPEEYKPERFLPEAKRNLKPYTFFPYGEGPRNCIGSRFAKMVMIACLVTFFKKFRVELAGGMPRSLEMDPNSILTQCIDGINLKFIRRNGREQRTST